MFLGGLGLADLIMQVDIKRDFMERNSNQVIPSLKKKTNVNAHRKNMIRINCSL